MEKIFNGIYVDVKKSIEVVLKLEEAGGAIKPTLDVKIPDKNKDVPGINEYAENIKRIIKAEVKKDNEGKASVEILLGKLKVGEIKGYQLFGTLDAQSGEYSTKALLTSSELRFLSQSKIEDIEKLDIPFDRKQTKTPKTDLHTHLSGALTAEDMLEIGHALNVYIPVRMLEKAGIDTGKYNLVEHGKFNRKSVDKNGEQVVVSEPIMCVRFNDLSPEDIKKYSDKLSIQSHSQQTFVDMENCYDFRDPFVKNKADFLEKDQMEEAMYLRLRCLARHYRETGVKYAELSMSEVCKDPAQTVQLLDKVMPRIEEEFPDVSIRFLGGIPRVIGSEFQKHRNESLLSASKSEYVTGLDVMAHEVNMTSEFAEILGDCVEYATSHQDENFVIRVHAGESDLYKDNVKQFLHIVDDYLKSHPGTKPPIIRIGHGIHGLDAETVDLCKQLGAVIEINASSNLALNNISSLDELGTKRYMDEGIRVVLGTDGHGMYGTDAQQEAAIAVACGATEEDMERMSEFEESYISGMTASFEKKRQNADKLRREALTQVVSAIKDAMAKLKGGSHSDRELASIISEKLHDTTAKVYLDVSPEEVEEILKSGLHNMSAEQIAKLDRKEVARLLPGESYVRIFSPGAEKVAGLLDRGKQHDSEKKTKVEVNVLGFSEKISDKTEVFGRSEGSGEEFPAIEDRKPVCIVGFSDEAWKKLDQTQQATILKQLIDLVGRLDPKKVFVVTKMEASEFNVKLHEIISKVNPELYTLGVTDEKQIGQDRSRSEAEQNKYADWVKGHFNGVKVAKGNGFTYSKALVSYLKKNGGELFAFGEGSFGSDYITDMHNINGALHVFNTAGSKKAKLYSGTEFCFDDVSEILPDEPAKGLSKEEMKQLIKKLLQTEEGLEREQVEKAEQSINKVNVGEKNL